MSELVRTTLDTQALIETLLRGRLEEANKARARLREKKLLKYLVFLLEKLLKNL
jgi:hypothetical protein